MQTGGSPIATEVVLVGGGHSHALLLRMLGMKPWHGIAVTLISDVTHTPYSGMLPGLVAGIYEYEEAHIDLRRLCQFAGVRFIRAEVSGLDLEQKRVQLEGRPSVRFDLVSLNTGSRPEMANVPGARAHAVPAKPVPVFLDRWEAILREAESDQAGRRLVIVGGGAGGVELAVGMKERLGDTAEVSIVHQGDALLSTHNEGVQKRFAAILDKRKIAVHLKESVIEVVETGVLCQSGLKLEADSVFWVTNAGAPAWPAESGLAVDERDFVRIGETLQSVSHPFVFATGDLASMEDHPRPKSGVFAVRMGRPLFQNLRRHALGQSLIDYKPQKEFLSLIGTATRSAVA
ncbi:MAG: FAD-dependent oxidoreductase, partial [Verrucomicrobiota bacterium]